LKTTTSGQAVTIDPVGLVENSIKEPILFSHEKGLEMQGQLEQFWKKVRQVEQVESRIIIDPERSDLLEGIEAYSHLLVIYWGHKTPAAGRTLNQVHPMGRKDLPLTGVFTTCSPARPNPVLMTVVELLGRQDNILTVKHLDAIDQSPVLDIKPYVKELFPQEGVRTPDWMRELMQEAAERRGSA
jgi:tRNA-Thr(GGU) m(6)t(6)A37 methyltransferase TsaA